MALWDHEKKTITNEFTMAFALWKYPHQYGPTVLIGPPTDLKLIQFPLEWSMSKRAPRLDDPNQFVSQWRLESEREQTEMFPFYYPHLTRLPKGLRFDLAVKRNNLDGSIQMILSQKDESEEDVFTVGISFLEYVKNKDGATVDQAYRVEKLWKLEAILNTGLIYGQQEKLEHLNAAMESSQTEEEKTFYGTMIRELLGRYRLHTRDYPYLMNAWGSDRASDWPLRIHCYMTEYPSRLELVEGSAKRTPEEGTGPIIFSADYKNMASDVVKRLEVKQDLTAKEPFMQVCLEDPLVPKSKTGINIPMEKYGNGDLGNLWQITASVKIMLLSKDEHIQQIPSLLRWIRCAKTDEIKSYFLVMLKDCIGGDMVLFHEVMKLIARMEARDLGFTLTEEDIDSVPMPQEPEQPQAESSRRRSKRCLIA